MASREIQHLYQYLGCKTKVESMYESLKLPIHCHHHNLSWSVVKNMHTSVIKTQARLSAKRVNWNIITNLPGLSTTHLNRNIISTVPRLSTKHLNISIITSVTGLQAKQLNVSIIATLAGVLAEHHFIRSSWWWGWGVLVTCLHHTS